MRVAGRDIPVSLLQWVGLLGAPLAWASQHIAGIGLTLAQCNASGRTWHVPVHGVTIAITAVAATTAAVSLAAAAATMHAIDADVEEPPASRIRFLGVVGVTTDFMLLCIILMSGSGSVFHGCGQS